MDIKRGLILVFIVLLVVVNIAHFMVLNTIDKTLITGEATGSSQGTSSICIDKPPTITSIADQTATVDTAFTLQVSATDADDSTLTYSDNTSLFNINGSGYISFTPTSATTETVLITVTDNAGCLSHSSTDTFVLTISAAAEEPVAAAPSTGGAGGGGGGGSGPPSEEVEVSFDISDQTMRVSLRESRGMERRLTVTNDGTATLEFEVENSLDDVLHITPSSFTLAPGQDQELRFVFNPLLNADPDIYSGLVEIRGTFGGTITEDIYVVAEIESDEVVVDASLDLVITEINAGDDLTTTITLFNLREITEAEVYLTYLILGTDQTIIHEETETIMVRNQVSFNKAFTLPDDLSPGTYLLSLKIVYEDTLAAATETFTIEAPVAEALPVVGLAAVFAKVPYLAYSLPIMMVLLVVILVVLYLLHKRVKKKHRPIVKLNRTRTIIKKHTIIKPKTIIKRKTIVKPDHSGLKRKLSLLKESYRRGYIKKDTYKNTKYKIQKMMK